MTFKTVVVKLVFLFSLRAHAEVAIGGDLVRLRPSSAPIVCNNGDLRVDSSDSNKLKICRSNVWSQIFDSGIAIQSISVTTITAGNLIVTSASSFAGNVTAAKFVGNLVGNVTGSLTGTASFATTASVTGLSDISKVSTAFAAVPAACSANQYANAIATTGNLTCTQVTFSQLSGTASIAQGGTNNGTLAVTNGGVLYSDGSKVMNAGAGNSGDYLKSVGAGTPLWTAFFQPKIIVFTTGTGVYTPSSTAKALWIRCVGAGGGGGGIATTSSSQNSAGSGGGGGSYLEKFVTAWSANFTYTIGAGGGGGTASTTTGGTGTAGSTTTFSNDTISLSAGGGQGGSGAGACGGPAFCSSWSNNGGAASGGDININGGSGGPGISLAAGGQGGTGGGGGSVLAPAQASITNRGSAAALSGVSFGQGGSSAENDGANASGRAGGTGGAGGCIIIELGNG